MQIGRKLFQHNKSLFYSLLLSIIFSLQVTGQQQPVTIPEFYYGFSAYPEWLTKEQQITLLDSLQSANVNFIRVGESSWGNIETAPGVFKFGWLRFFLDEMHKRNMKAMLGTCSYFPPQWLSAEHPEVLVVYRDGSKAHPMGRKDICRTHPLYVAAVKRYVTALGKEFGRHPAVVAWQLDNEPDPPLFNINFIDYNPANERAWTNWLKKKYKTVDNFNTKLRLIEWGLQVRNFEDVFIPGQTSEGFFMAQLWTLFQQYSTEALLDNFIMQRNTLRTAGVKQWITTNWTNPFILPVDHPKAKLAMDISGFTFYQSIEDVPERWRHISFLYDLSRNSNNINKFLSIETRIGVAADVRTYDNCGTREQFMMWMIHPAAFGSVMQLHWTANRFASGQWPQWGGVTDWSEKFEPDFAWIKETGTFYKKWGTTLVNNPVKADAAFITDFNSRLVEHTFPNGTHANINYYPAEEMIEKTVNAFHRLGIGIDALTPEQTRIEKLKQYKVIVVTSIVLEDSAAVKALETFALQGGTVLILPMTEYQTSEGVYLKNGFNKLLSSLSGTLVRTIRFNGRQMDLPNQKAVWNSLLTDSSIVGMNGFFELLEPGEGATVIATFHTPASDILHNRPAATIKNVGAGSVIKLGFFPSDKSAESLIQEITKGIQNTFLENILDENVQAIPRTDSSTIILNTSSKSIPVKLKKGATDRITQRKLEKEMVMNPYEILWLE